MNCPVCKNVSLMMTDRQGIEIDYCPQCRGVWLDRGELDRLIERAAERAPYEAGDRRDEGPERGFERRRDEGPERGFERRRDEDSRDYSRKRRRGILGDIFDF